MGAPAPRGQPQIEVTFEIDSDGILNVGAEDKASGKSEKITITNDKGRLSQEEIDRMVKEAEDMAEEDKKTKERIDAKNAFDGYIHSMRSAIEGSGGLGDKLEADEKSTVMDAVKEGQSWMKSNRRNKKSKTSAHQSCLSTMARLVVVVKEAPTQVARMKESTMSSKMLSIFYERSPKFELLRIG